MYGELHVSSPRGDGRGEAGRRRPAPPERSEGISCAPMLRPGRRPPINLDSQRASTARKGAPDARERAARGAAPIASSTRNSMTARAKALAVGRAPGMAGELPIGTSNPEEGITYMKKLILILAVAALPMAVYAADTPAKTTAKKHAHKHTTAASPAPDASPSPDAAGAATTATKKLPRPRRPRPPRRARLPPRSRSPP